LGVYLDITQIQKVSKIAKKGQKRVKIDKKLPKSDKKRSFFILAVDVIFFT